MIAFDQRSWSGYVRKEASLPVSAPGWRGASMRHRVSSGDDVDQFASTTMMPGISGPFGGGVRRSSRHLPRGGPRHPRRLALAAAMSAHGLLPLTCTLVLRLSLSRTLLVDARPTSLLQHFFRA